MQERLLKISIITVCYNSEATIEHTIRSVCGQDYPNIEYLIVDGNSTDRTMAIVEEHRNDIDRVISEKDKGLYDAMNKGIKLASGDIIGILNSDDVFYSDHVLSDVAAAFKEHPEAAAVYGNISYFNEKRQGVRTWITKPYYTNFFDDGEVPPHPSLFVRKSVYDTIGGYFPDFKISSDYEFMFRAFKVNGYKSFHLDKFIVNMRMGGESTRSVKNIIIGNQEVKKAWEMNKQRPNFRFWLLRISKKLLQLKKS